MGPVALRCTAPMVSMGRWFGRRSPKACRRNIAQGYYTGDWQKGMGGGACTKRGGHSIRGVPGARAGGETK